MDPDRLLLKIASGKKLSKPELDEVASRLEWIIQTEPNTGLSIDNAYPLLLVLGKAHAYEYKNLLDRFLSLSDPTTVSLVLEIISLEWKKTTDYLERILNLSLGTSWDYDEDVREIALKILGEYVYDTLHDSESCSKTDSAEQERESTLSIVALLLRTFEDETASEWVRRRAYYALMRVAGKAEDEIPSEYLAFDLVADIDSEVITQCRNLLDGPGSSGSPSSASTSTGLLSGIR